MKVATDMRGRRALWAHETNLHVRNRPFCSQERSRGLDRVRYLGETTDPSSRLISGLLRARQHEGPVPAPARAGCVDASKAHMDHLRQEHILIVAGRRLPSRNDIVDGVRPRREVLGTVTFDAVCRHAAREFAVRQDTGLGDSARLVLGGLVQARIDRNWPEPLRRSVLRDQTRRALCVRGARDHRCGRSLKHLASAIGEQGRAEEKSNKAQPHYRTPIAKEDRGRWLKKKIEPNSWLDRRPCARASG